MFIILSNITLSVFSPFLFITSPISLLFSLIFWDLSHFLLFLFLYFFLPPFFLFSFLFLSPFPSFPFLSFSPLYRLFLILFDLSLYLPFSSFPFRSLSICLFPLFLFYLSPLTFLFSLSLFLICTLSPLHWFSTFFPVSSPLPHYFFSLSILSFSFPLILSSRLLFHSPFLSASLLTCWIEWYDGLQSFRLTKGHLKAVEASPRFPEHSNWSIRPLLLRNPV